MAFDDAEAFLADARDAKAAGRHEDARSFLRSAYLLNREARYGV